MNAGEVDPADVMAESSYSPHGPSKVTAGTPGAGVTVPEVRYDPSKGWRSAPDCALCEDTGRSQVGTTEAHCACKRGRRMSELWLAEKHGLPHPDEPEPDWDGAPF